MQGGAWPNFVDDATAGAAWGKIPDLSRCTSARDGERLKQIAAAYDTMFEERGWSLVNAVPVVWRRAVWESASFANEDREVLPW